MPEYQKRYTAAKQNNKQQKKHKKTNEIYTQQFKTKKKQINKKLKEKKGFHHLSHNPRLVKKNPAIVANRWHQKKGKRVKKRKKKKGRGMEKMSQPATGKRNEKMISKQACTPQ